MSIENFSNILQNHDGEGLTVFEILLFEGRSVLSRSQRGTGSERVKISMKMQKTIRLLLKLLEK